MGLGDRVAVAVKWRAESERLCHGQQFVEDTHVASPFLLARVHLSFTPLSAEGE